MTRRHIDNQPKTKFKAHGNRIAGSGIEYDCYDETSFPDDFRNAGKNLSYCGKRKTKVNDNPIKKYKLTEEELKYYKNLK